MDLRDKYGKVLGRIRESSNGNLELYDHMGAYAGKYDFESNTTYDKYGAYFGSGNLLAILLHTA